MARRDPPLVLRETLPLPACEFPAVDSKLQGIKSLMIDHDIASCITSLREVYADWERAIEEKQVLNHIALFSFLLSGYKRCITLIFSVS
jgi:hypothetical protein